MKNKQEPKYMIVATPDGYRIANRATEEVIPEDEPIMIFRARDIHAVAAIDRYLQFCQDPHHREVVRGRLNQFLAWAENNPDRMKEPDTASF